MGNEQRIEREYFTKAMQAMATNPEARRHMLDGLKNRKDAREILTDMLDTKKTKTGKTPLTRSLPTPKATTARTGRNRKPCLRRP